MVPLGSANNAILFPPYDSTPENLVYQILSTLGGNPSHLAFTDFHAENPTGLPPYKSNLNSLIYEWLSVIKNQCFTGIIPDFKK